jgi:hypothetical protein
MTEDRLNGLAVLYIHNKSVSRKKCRVGGSNMYIVILLNLDLDLDFLKSKLV